MKFVTLANRVPMHCPVYMIWPGLRLRPEYLALGQVLYAPSADT